MEIIERKHDETPFNCDECWKPHNKRIVLENATIDLCEECYEVLILKMQNN